MLETNTEGGLSLFQEHYLINIHNKSLKYMKFSPVCRCLKLKKVVQLPKIMGVVRGDLKLTSGPKSSCVWWITPSLCSSWCEVTHPGTVHFPSGSCLTVRMSGFLSCISYHAMHLQREQPSLWFGRLAIKLIADERVIASLHREDDWWSDAGQTVACPSLSQCMKTLWMSPGAW